MYVNSTSKYLKYPKIFQIKLEDLLNLHKINSGSQKIIFHDFQSVGLQQQQKKYSSLGLNIFL